MFPSHCLVHSARRDDKMSRAELRGRTEWMDGNLLWVVYAPSSEQRQVAKRFSNAKRRRRDRSESERY